MTPEEFLCLAPPLPLLRFTAASLNVRAAETRRDELDEMVRAHREVLDNARCEYHDALTALEESFGSTPK